MNTFIQHFRERGQLSFVGMREVAMALLPEDRIQCDALYYELQRGKAILNNDDSLNMYLKSFGKMHKAKLDTAFAAIPYPERLANEKIEIYDWGCGQGTATICLLDFF